MSGAVEASGAGSRPHATRREKVSRDRCTQAHFATRVPRTELCARSKKPTITHRCRSGGSSPNPNATPVRAEASRHRPTTERLRTESPRPATGSAEAVSRARPRAASDGVGALHFAVVRVRHAVATALRPRLRTLRCDKRAERGRGVAAREVIEATDDEVIGVSDAPARPRDAVRSRRARDAAGRSAFRHTPKRLPTKATTFIQRR